MILRQNLLLNLMNQIENCEEVLNGFFQQYYNSLLSKISNMENDELTINNFLVDCYKDADEALRKLDYSSNYFNTETTKFINSAREFLNEEQIEKINKLSEDYKVNFNKAMYNVIDNLAKTNTEKIGDIKIIKQETEKEDTLVDSNVMNNGVQNQEIPNNESELKNDNPSIIEEKKQTEPIVVEESVESKTEVVEDKKQVNIETSNIVNNETFKQVNTKEETKRQTYFLTPELIRAISLMSAHENQDKSVIVREALKA